MSSAPPAPPRRARPGPPPWTAAAPQPDPASVAGVGPPPPLSWAKRTGFRARFSGESTPVTSGQMPLPRPHAAADATLPDLEAGRNHALPPPPSAAPAPANGEPEKKDRPPAQPIPSDPPSRRRNSDGVPNGAAPVSSTQARGDPVPPRTSSLPLVEDDDDDFRERRLHINYELRDTPGLVPIVFYALQHYLSILGSLILIPLVLVPAMGGTYDDTAKVVSTVLFISGVTTLLHTSFGTRLPLIQGPSFVFLAPVLAIINSLEFQGLNDNNFRHIMKELQGALIISSAFQAIMGYTGFMSLFLRYSSQ